MFSETPCDFSEITNILCNWFLMDSRFCAVFWCSTNVTPMNFGDVLYCHLMNISYVSLLKIISTEMHTSVHTQMALVILIIVGAACNIDQWYRRGWRVETQKNAPKQGKCSIWPHRWLCKHNFRLRKLIIKIVCILCEPKKNFFLNMCKTSMWCWVHSGGSCWEGSWGRNWKGAQESAAPSCIVFLRFDAGNLSTLTLRLTVYGNSFWCMC